MLNKKQKKTKENLATHTNKQLKGRKPIPARLMLADSLENSDAQIGEQIEKFLRDKQRIEEASKNSSISCGRLEVIKNDILNCLSGQNPSFSKVKNLLETGFNEISKKLTSFETDNKEKHRTQESIIKSSEPIQISPFFTLMTKDKILSKNKQKLCEEKEEEKEAMKRCLNVLEVDKPTGSVFKFERFEKLVSGFNTCGCMDTRFIHLKERLYALENIKDFESYTQDLENAFHKIYKKKAKSGEYNVSLLSLKLTRLYLC